MSDLINADKIWYSKGSIQSYSHLSMALYGDAKDVYGRVNCAYGDITGFSGNISIITNRLDLYRELGITNLDEFESGFRLAGFDNAGVYRNEIIFKCRYNKSLIILFHCNKNNDPLQYSVFMAKCADMLGSLPDIKNISLFLYTSLIYELEADYSFNSITMRVLTLTDQIVLCRIKSFKEYFSISYENTDTPLYSKNHKVIEEAIISSLGKLYPNIPIRK